MTDHATSEDRYMDDQLAEFADQVISSKAPEDIPTSEDADMRNLQNTIIKIQENVVEGGPDARMASRIKANVLKEFAKEFGGATQKETAQNWLSRLISPREKSWQSTSSRNKGLVLRIAAVAAAVILAMIPFATVPEGDLPAAAIGDIGLIPVFLIVLAAGVITYFIFRRK